MHSPKNTIALPRWARSAEAQLGVASKQILIRLYAHLLFMAEAIDASNLMSELRAIRNDLDFIKEHMVDIDNIMTEDDYLALEEYRKEKKRMLVNLYHTKISRKNWDYDVRYRIFKAGYQVSKICR